MNTQKIKILDQQEIWKIAAGEVVERPASVVKELVENSLDAGASTISVFLERAGKQLIRISDDGCGMSEKDASLCIVPHATSKISSLDDLARIDSFGFRGEALASVAAISRLEIRTKVDDGSSDGLSVTVRDGKVDDVKTLPLSVGTDVIVQDIFYNTPVRYKFLKQNETEINQVQQVLFSHVLANCGVHFKLYCDGKIMLNAPAVQCLADRIAQLFDTSLAANMLAVEGSSDGMMVTGLTSNMRVGRYNRQQIFVFINGRHIKNSPLARAIIKAYGRTLPDGKFPSAFLFLQIDPGRVDVNVHPRKDEVRFTHPGKVEQLIKAAIVRALEDAATIGAVSEPQTTFGDPSVVGFQPSMANEVPLPDPFVVQEENRSFIPASTGVVPSDSTVSASESSDVDEPLRSDQVEVPAQRLALEPDEFKPSGMVDSPSDIRIIGQLFKTYIIIERDNELVIVDQHAAHERILYEQMQSDFSDRPGIRLLFPEIVDLERSEVAAILKIVSELARTGIAVEQFGPKQIVVTTAPPKVQGSDLAAFIKEVAAFVCEHEHLEEGMLRKKLSEHVHSHLACKTALKAGDVMGTMAMEQLIRDLDQTKNRHQCIHGRPTTWKFSRKEVEHAFRRPSS